MSNSLDTDARKTIIVFPRGTLDAKTKEQLSKNGYLGIEADDPKAVVTVLPVAPITANLSGDEIVQAMVKALLVNNERMKSFGENLLATMQAKK